MLKNLSGGERVFSLIVGGLTLSHALRGEGLSALSRSAWAGLGASLLARGSSGHCPVYQKLDYNPRINLKPEEAKPENSILVNKPLEEVKKFLRESTLPFGSFFPGREDNEFSARIGADLWLLTLSGSQDGKRTFMKRSVEADKLQPTLESGKAWVKTALNKLPFDEAFDLRKLRSLIETGEIATIKGQPHGRRSSFGKALEKVKSELALPQIHENGEASVQYARFQGANI